MRLSGCDISTELKVEVDALLKLVWTSRKVCQDFEQYYSVVKSNMADMNSMLVLDEFELTFNDDNPQWV